jgi:tetratricopeptide (TPR) repeat protein
MPVTSPLPTRPVFPPASGKVVAPPVVSALTKKLEKPAPLPETKKDAPPPVDLEEEIATVKIPAPTKEKEETPADKPAGKSAEKSAEKPADKPGKPAATAPLEETPEPKAPRRTYPILIYACASLALLMLYYVWSPYHAVSVLRNALNNGEVADLNSAIDFPSVRQTLKQQIHDQVAQSNLQGASSDSVSSALAMIDHSIDYYVTPEEISALIKTPDSVTPGDQGPTISPAVAANLLLAFNSHGQPARSQGLASIGDFVLDWDIALLHLRFQVLGWKLNHIDLRPDLPVQGVSDATVPLLSPVVDTYLESGNAKMKKSDWNGAIADFTQVLAIDPQSSVAYNDRAGARQSKNDLDGAIKDYTQALTIDPQMATAYNGRGNAKATKNDVDGAIADFTQAIQLDPTMAIAYDSRGNLKATKNDMDGAIADFTQAIALDPNMASAYSDRGFARQANNNLDGAIADYTQALALKPKTAMSYYNRGLARQAQGNLDAAIVDFDRALAFDPKIAGAYYNRGNAKNANHDIDGAIADYTQALALNPKIAPAYSNRGTARQSKGDLDGALSDYTQALNLDPKISTAYYNRAVIEAQKDDLDSAIADTTQALYLDSKNAQAYNIRGFAKLAKGNLDGALADLKQSNDLAPKDNVRLYLWLISKAQNSKVDADQELSDALENSWNSRPDELVSKTAAFFLGRMNEADYLAAADSPDPKIDQGQHCQVWYFAGMKRLLSGDKKGAIDAFHECIATGQKDSFEYLLAQTELQVLEPALPALPPGNPVAAPVALPVTPPVAQPVKGP